MFLFLPLPCTTDDNGAGGMGVHTLLGKTKQTKKNSHPSRYAPPGLENHKSFYWVFWSVTSMDSPRKLDEGKIISSKRRETASEIIQGFINSWHKSLSDTRLFSHLPTVKFPITMVSWGCFKVIRNFRMLSNKLT